MSQPSDGFLANVSNKTILLVGAAILAPGVGYAAYLMGHKPEPRAVPITAEAPAATPVATQTAATRPTASAATAPAITQVPAAAVAPAPAASAGDTSGAIPTGATWAEALAIAKPAMADTFDKHDPGSVMLANWLLRTPDWAGIQALPETSFAKVAKDSDEERGKKLCSGGKITQITSEKTKLGKSYGGVLQTPGYNYVYFVALGSSGDLVMGSQARFCGVATGRHTYSNSGGGVTHAVRVVGMFDLPENKKKL